MKLTSRMKEAYLDVLLQILNVLEYAYLLNKVGILLSGILPLSDKNRVH